MDRNEVLLKISDSVAKIVEHRNFKLKETTTAEDVDGWESVTHMMIIADVEESFSIKFKLMDLMNMNNVGDLISAVQSELK